VGPGRAARAGAARAAWRYRVDVGPGARELAIEGEFSGASAEELSVAEGAEPFVRGVEVLEGRAWSPVAARGESWFVPACAARGCRVRYRFDLAGAAAALDDFDRAGGYEGGAILAPPSTWLLRPLGVAGPGRLRLAVAAPRGVAFVSGWPREGGGDEGAYVADVGDVDDAPYAGFGPFRRRQVALAGGGRLEVAFAPGAFAKGDDRFVAHVASTAEAVASFYGRFPVGRALVVVTPVAGRGVAFGKASGGGGAAVVLVVGAETGEADLRGDWVTAHEMLHLGFPWLPRRHRWLAEGVATYVEPLVRLRAGLVDEASVWREFVARMPQGLPRAGDRGLDRTPTWGRTYWGGALFCLVADVTIRRRTAGARSLDDALRGVARAGGNAGARWSIADALAAGDRAAGVPVLRELYASMAEAPAPVDLEALWGELGVRVEGERVTFDDGAPLAAVRAAITAGAAAPVGPGGAAGPSSR
jgi:hypothetical protein